MLAHLPIRIKCFISFRPTNPVGSKSEKLEKVGFLIYRFINAFQSDSDALKKIVFKENATKAQNE